MRSLRALLAAAALAAVALIAPTAASAAPVHAQGFHPQSVNETRAATLAYGWDG